MNKKKSTSKARRELRGIFERVIEWIGPREKLQKKMIEWTLDGLGDMAKVFPRDLVAAKSTKWSHRPRSRL